MARDAQLIAHYMAGVIRAKDGRMKSLAGTLALAPAEPSLLDPCTCLRDDQPCRVCDLWDRHIGWLEARPEHQAQRRVETDV